MKLGNLIKLSIGVAVSALVVAPCFALDLNNLSRGEAVDLAVKYFDLEKTNTKFLRECDNDLDSCLFTFTARTNFDELKTEPLILYPDVYPAYRYYRAINVASKLDLVRGYFEEDQSPFRPEQPITKAESLKLILGASGALNWKEKFELNADDQQLENQAKSMLVGMTDWWYGRYIGTAWKKGMFTQADKVNPDASISKNEFMVLMEKSKLAYGQNSQENSSGNTQFEANNSTGKTI